MSRAFAWPAMADVIPYRREAGGYVSCDLGFIKEQLQRGFALCQLLYHDERKKQAEVKSFFSIACARANV